MDQSLTEQAARDRSYDYLRQTLAALPPGVSLSYHPDSPVLGDLRPGVTVPCDDSNTVEHGPWNVQIRYWLVGVPPGQDRHYFDLIRAFWAGKGWTIRHGSTDDYTVATTPDGYSIALQDAGKGHGSLSLATFSPCFPESAQGTTTPQPSVIEPSEAK
ncbi:hypothetical protein G4X40_09145 [Rhodococcus sp. D2-41]|uniref:hypothetical protein n=1 Tax=Speluncibacter jeojiensis TaxID=2710754 RepID=UPI0024108144|nr:hypothetical protein [Rhodococcus sp. D2-41]MDG3010317.1 hypothetical protein [Rhodococcus sp. D2-41]